jgi:hypothetical protein
MVYRLDARSDRAQEQAAGFTTDPVHVLVERLDLERYQATISYRVLLQLSILAKNPPRMCAMLGGVICRG